MDLKLGLIYKDGVIINHRSLLKVLLNPILRFFAFQIGTPANQERTEVKGICLSKCKRTKTIMILNVIS